MGNLKRWESKIKTIISIILISLMLSGCGFSGYAKRLENGTIKWKSNRPAIIEDTKEEYKVDGKGQKLIDLEIPLLKKE